LPYSIAFNRIGHNPWLNFHLKSLAAHFKHLNIADSPITTYARNVLTHTANQLLQSYLNMDTPTADEPQSDSSTSYHMPTIAGPSYHLPTIQTADPVSPRTVVNALLAFDDVPQDTL
jgi:hypothetical protein